MDGDLMCAKAGCPRCCYLKVGLGAYVAMVVATIFITVLSVLISAALATLTGGIGVVIYAFAAGAFMDYLLDLVRESLLDLICFWRQKTRYKVQFS